MKTYTCNKCNESKTEVEMSRSRGKASKTCKKCTNAKANAYYHNKNKDKQIAASKKWTVANREKHNEVKRKWQLKNPEKRKAHNKMVTSRTVPGYVRHHFSYLTKDQTDFIYIKTTHHQSWHRELQYSKEDMCYSLKANNQLLNTKAKHLNALKEWAEANNHENIVYDPDLDSLNTNIITALAFEFFETEVFTESL